MTSRQASKLKLVNALSSIASEIQATMRANAIERAIRAYKDGMITAREFAELSL